MVKISINSERCKGCSLCTRVCPKNILEIDKSMLNSKGYHPVHITDESKCIACASCARMCPDLVFEIEK